MSCIVASMQGENGHYTTENHLFSIVNIRVSWSTEMINSKLKLYYYIFKAMHNLYFVIIYRI